MNKRVIPQADITWDERGLPRSTVFDDKYFCEDDGYAESLHTFCGGNRLVERFQLLGAETFVLGETGFGTGLNFLCAVQLFNLSLANF